ncbi:mutator protein [Hordeum vulgare]|nr:mutator protein [Hordeum vulgare]
MAPKHAPSSVAAGPTKKSKKATSVEAKEAKRAIDAEEKEVLMRLRKKRPFFFPSVLLANDLVSRHSPMMVWLLNDVYDAEHRAYFMSEKKMEPEVEDGGKKDRVPAGATFTWIAANFAHCPEDADDEVIQRYARVYMWYVISRTIFADGTGKNAPWMWLKALTVLDNKFSWGSAALAYLYRQLDDACRRTTKDGGVGGCMLLLSVWSWERLPVGRPKSSKWNTWDDHDNPVRQPTWAYKWDLVSEVAREVNLLYKQYTNEMDSLTPEQVEWEPYGVGTNFGDAHTFQLNPLCVQERHLWLMRCPLSHPCL